MTMWQQFTQVFTSTELVIPAAQMGAYVITINIMMLCAYYRACYIISLSFAYYWLFILNQKNFVTPQGELQGGIYAYLIIGMLFLLAVLYSLFNRKD
ncbi:hypothetical protein ACFL6N_04270 [Thermodesulfobacteriota bacterium]